MKAARRKDLKTNELIQSIQELVQTVRQYGGHIAVAAIALVLVVAIGFYWRYSQQQRLHQAWSDVLMAAQPGGVGPVDRLQQLEQIAADHEGEHVGAVANLLLAGALVDEVTYGSAAGDATRREELLAQADRAYRHVVERYEGELVPRGAALMGLANLAEQQRDWQQAQSWYQKILADKRLEVTPYRTLAARGLEAWPKLPSQKVVFVEAAASTQPTATSQSVAANPASAAAATLPSGGD
ncbi:MAG TPA: hypothetical protein VMZ31_09065 [Phycisphaerae bacterium]|nr:hypothetical protein [Phycisphaerae bacterium]